MKNIFRIYQEFPENGHQCYYTKVNENDHSRTTASSFISGREKLRNGEKKKLLAICFRQHVVRLTRIHLTKTNLQKLSREQVIKTVQTDPEKFSSGHYVYYTQALSPPGLEVL